MSSSHAVHSRDEEFVPRLMYPWNTNQYIHMITVARSSLLPG